MCDILSKEHAAYIAGIVDGEGCFGAVVGKEGYIYPQFELVNTNKQALDWLRCITGIGTVYSCKQVPGNLPKWTWTISIQPAAELARQLLPYLRIKGLQAQLYCTLAAFRRMPIKDRSHIKDIGFTLAAMITADKRGGRKSKRKAS